MSLKEQQSVFAAHLRSPDAHAAPAGMEERRMKIYRDLFFNNVRNFISGAFPVLKSLHSDDGWDALVRDFYAGHKAQTPYFLEISEEFLAWLGDEHLPIHQRLPFARELAHYEWVELGLDVANELPADGVDPEGDLLHGTPVLSAVAWPLAYRWPVHLIGPAFQPHEPPEQPTCLVVYRNADDKVQFLEANPVTLRLLEIIAGDPGCTGEQALRQLAREMPAADEGSVVGFGLETLEDLRRLGIIAGSRRC